MLPQAPRVAFEESPEKALPKLTLKSKKPKKAKPLAPEQASGMSTMDLTACRNCIKKLFESRHAAIFLHPVDPVRDSAPNYFDVIKEPIDLTTISDKLNAGLYRDRFHFKEDFELMIRNAVTYTPDPNAYAHLEAMALEKDFNRQWTRITRTLEQAEARHAKPAEQAAPIPLDAPVSSARAYGPAATAEAPTAPPSKIVTSMPPPAYVPAAASPAPSTPIGGVKAAGGSGLGLKLKLKSRPSLGSAPGSGTTTPRAAGSPPPASAAARAGSPPGAVRAGSPPRAAGRAGSPPRPAGGSARSSPAPRASPGPSSKASSSKGGAAARPSLATQDPVGASGDEPIYPKRVKPILAAIKKMPEAFFFLRPVDPIADGAPTYYDEIKRPMDLGTMEKRLNGTGGATPYTRMAEFAEDMMQIFANARQFNPPGTLPAAYADACEAAFLKEWSKALVPRLEYVEKRALQGMLTRLKANVIVSGLFLFPVDPIAQGVPHYHDVIPKEQCRDLTTIENNLKADRYTSLRAVTDDMQLMMANARTFNAGVDELLAMVDTFEKAYKKEMTTVRAAINAGGGGASGAGGGTKRKDGGEAGGSASASKKAKT